MSQENVEIVQGCCDAFNRGDHEAALDVLDPAIEYDLRHRLGVAQENADLVRRVRWRSG